MAEKNPTICIIDDNPDDRDTFRRYLLQDPLYRYQCYEAETGEDGLLLCRQIQPDCILLDYKLPDIDGLEFLAELVDSSGSVPFAVIILAGLGDEGIALQAMKSGAQDYLVKDEMTPGNLFRAIHHAIERTTMRRALEKHQQDLEQKNQEIQAFAYALAHDLRAPLRAITGFSQIVEQDYHDVLDDSGRHYVENIVHACSQMDRLIDDLLNYTRIEHRALRYKPVALDYLLRQIVKSMETRLQKTGATVTLAEDLPTIYGDSTLINQIFVNLLDNALVYHKPDEVAQVTVSWWEDGEFVVIRLADTGIGIAPKFYEKIFNIFQRLHSEEIYPGTGIGLAIVKKAVDLSGGLVWVESTLGVGSNFFVKLPKYIV
ncbi:hybrid sensor histidine kinase/response regulator [Dictyobacter aurantiacus]|uniref:histidine kinase n=1 Tax=Dictyobacter aurantiacus TaxID=1936993 RepID=A0A401ZHF2_9CHLR|nr:hybrid sensor histidine kinase/response regulator [Dictyobacter aurantiacus]GCE06311.1 hybrid sensor histidine kinase/response regulator [Dictyobacter aurantiacus]